MGEEELAEFRKRQIASGQDLAIIHPGTSTGSPAEASDRPWKQFIETMDGKDTLPGLIYYRDTNGVIKRHWIVNTAGVQTVTEASAATIATNSGYHSTMLRGLLPTFADTTTMIGNANINRRIFSVDLTSDGAGAIAATAIVPALAGYTGHAQIIGIWASATDAATTWTFACAAGTALGPLVHAVAHTANAVTQFGATAAGVTGCPIYIRGTVAADDNKALTVSAAGYAATQTATIFGYYWYET